METVRYALHVLLVIFGVLVLFNLLVAVHELGHFLAARWRGLVVDKFRIWFGKPIWKTTRGGVEYSLGWIPAGGFVALPQMAPMDSIEGKIEGARPNLPAASPLDKIIVALAGPVFSFGLACVFAVIVWLTGRPVSEAEKTTTIGYVRADSPALKAGLRAGDTMLAIDGQPVRRFLGMSESVQWYVARAEGDQLAVKVRRDGEEQTVNVAATRPQKTRWYQRPDVRQIGVEPAYTPKVGEVKPGGPADRAGLRTGDYVTAVNGQPLLSIEPFVEAEQGRYGQPLTLTIERAGQSQTVTLPPMPFTVGVVSRDGPAELAGLKTDDVIRAVSGRPAERFDDLREATKTGTPFEITVQPKAGGPERVVTLVPERERESNEFKVGLGPAYGADGITWDVRGRVTTLHENPVDQVQGGVMSVVNTLGALLSPKSEVKLTHLGGPVTIFRGYFEILLEQGLRLALWFSVIINVNLAILNLLPFPVLDGGHIVLALIEAVRRRPANVRVLEFIQTGCAMVLIGYMLFITFFDVGDLARGGGRRDARPRFERAGK